ncbi:MAG: FKBP-type peptidyl-prolyl cis-trans isomerase [Planctomycetota bacterium]|jgi:FKBP-type peptidyl-prolyl cis-trans isomerase
MIPRSVSRSRQSVSRLGLLRSLLLVLCLLPVSSCGLLGSRTVSYDSKTLSSGVVLRDLVVPDKGLKARLGDRVAIEYELFLRGESGRWESIDSTWDRGRPARFELGGGEVPAGLEEGLRGMRLFGQRRIVVPPAQGFGDVGQAPLIPPGATLRFEVELMELEKLAVPAN